MVSIKRMAELREELGLTHLILFGINEDNSQVIATHGKSEKQAIKAADYGNNLKKHLGFPEKMCNSEPVKRECYYCDFYQNPPGSFERLPGYCCYNVPKQQVWSDRKSCGNFVPRF